MIPDARVAIRVLLLKKIDYVSANTIVRYTVAIVSEAGGNDGFCGRCYAAPSAT
jgi:hypothetical protein